MECPKCHVSQPKSGACISCGLIFEHDKPAGSFKRKAPFIRTDHIKKNKSTSVIRIWIAALVITVISAGAIISIYTKQPDPLDTPVKPAIVEESRGDLFQSAIDAMVIVRSPWAEGYGFFINGRGHILTPKRLVSYEKTDTDPVWKKIRKLNDELERKQKRLDVIEDHLTFNPSNDHSFWDRMDKADALEEDIEKIQKQIEQYETGPKVFAADGSERNVEVLNVSETTNVALLSVDLYNSSYIQPLKEWPTEDYLASLLADAYKPNGDTAYIVCSLKGLNELKLVKAAFSHNTTYGANHYSVTTRDNVSINAVGSPLLNKEGMLLGICDFEFYQGKGSPIVPVLDEFRPTLGY